MMRAYLIAGWVFAVLVASTSIYLKGLADGEINQLKDTVAAERARKGIDNETNGLDDFSLCLRIGGLPDQCEQLRGLDATAAD